MGKKKSSLRYVAGMCFAVIAINALIDLIQLKIRIPEMTIWDLLLSSSVSGLALVALSLFAALPVLTSAGAGIIAILGLMNLIQRTMGGHIYPQYSLIVQVLGLVFWGLLIVAGIKKKSAKQLGFIASGVTVLRFAISLMGSIITYGTVGLTFRGVLAYVFLAVGAFIIGMAIESITTKVPGNYATATGTEVCVNSNTESE